MDYNEEKYREKREKVLGVRKRKSLNFVTISTIVSIVFILSIGIVVVPRLVDYLVNRNFDDAIYKLQNLERWPKDVLDHVSRINGVEKSILDKNGTRLVITFNRSVVNIDSFYTVFREQKIKAILLNRMNHRQRATAIQEEQNLETI